MNSRSKMNKMEKIKKENCFQKLHKIIIFINE